MQRLSLLLIWILIFSIKLFATHNRAGEIRYKQLDDLSIQAEIITYTKTSSISADRDTLNVLWGDGTSTSVPRENGKGFILANDIKMNIYTMEHTYPGRGEYTISVLDPNRVENILNVDPPNSVNIPFYIQTTIKLFNSTFQGINHSPILTNPPIDIACLGQIFIHNPGAIDEDGDSLAYELITPLMDINTRVPNYLLPSQIKPGLNNTISMDSRTGTFTWNSPQLAGEYNIAIAIYEFRKGVLISSTIRDMEILVLESCSKDEPPTIFGVKDTCIIAGQTLNLKYFIDDLDRNKKGGRVKIQTYGAPFIVQPIATTDASGNFDQTNFVLNFQWNTECIHINKEYYNIIIKATDNYFDTSGLSTTFILRVKVIGPAPINLMSTATNKSILLNWNYPYKCDSLTSNFKGFSIWRRENPGPSLDTCVVGLEKYGYEKIEYLTNLHFNSQYQYLDTNVARNKNYCYRVQAEFALLTSSNFLYNFTPSLASNETCSNIQTNEPNLLNVDVRETSNSTGKIFVRYKKPNTQLYDTIIHPAPYTIKIYSSTNNSPYNELVTFRKFFNSFSAILDTTYNLDNLNTNSDFHQYNIGISSAKGEEIKSEPSSQVFLQAKNFNKSILIQWKAKTPWNNYKYTIFKKLSSSTLFDSIATITDSIYIDQNIILDSNYCYLLKSYGQYFDPDFERPLINYSNITCLTAIDSTPPCCPNLSIIGPCEQNNIPNKIQLKLSFNEDSCSSKDISKFEIFRRNGDAIEILSTLNKDARSYEMNATELGNACFLVKSFNEKGLSCLTDVICESQCPEYLLPNTFTPNGDGHNDVFTPLFNRQVLSVEFVVINRWGNEIFRTKDPKINWDGKNKNGDILNDGTYYYSCKLFFQNPSNDKVLNGFIELLQGR